MTTISNRIKARPQRNLNAPRGTRESNRSESRRSSAQLVSYVRKIGYFYPGLQLRLRIIGLGAARSAPTITSINNQIVPRSVACPRPDARNVKVARARSPTGKQKFTEKQKERTDHVFVNVAVSWWLRDSFDLTSSRDHRCNWTDEPWVES